MPKGFGNSSDNPSGKKNGDQNPREVKPLHVQDSHKKLQGELGQSSQASEADQRQHPDDHKPRDPYDLTGHFTDMLRKSGALTPKISDQLRTTQDLAEKKKDVTDGTDAIKPQNSRLSEQQLTRDRELSRASFFEGYAQQAAKKLDTVLRTIYPLL